MIFSKEPPSEWNNHADSVFQTVEFASCLKKLNQKVIFVQGSNSQSLIVLFGSDKMRSFLSRANVYSSKISIQDVDNIIKFLDSQRIPFLRIGNTMNGPVSKSFFNNPIKRHTFVIDLSLNRSEIWTHMSKKARNAVRKAEREGVEVKELINKEEIEQYCNISQTSGIRIRQKRKSFSVFPSSFFHEVFSIMTGKGIAKFIGAFYQGELIAGGLFFIFRDKVLYYHGASLRSYSAKQGPSAIQWFNIINSKSLGIKSYDLGGSSPNLDSTDSRYFVHKFKKQWGGKSNYFFNEEIILSKNRYWIQDRIVSRIWMYSQPIINKLRYND